MKIDGIIYTTSKPSWLLRATKTILEVIGTSKGVEVGTLKIEQVALPKDFKVKQSGVAVRPDFDWFVKQYPQDGVIRCLHITRKEHDKLGLKHPNGGRLGGTYNRNIGDTSLEFLVVADTLSDFIRLFLHELSHGFSHWTGVKDMTHSVKNTLANMRALYPTYDFTKWNLQKTALNLLESIVGLLKGKQKSIEVPNKLVPLVERASADIILEMKKLGHEVRLVQGYRSIEEQNKLYEQGRFTPGAIVTNAKGGESYHNYGVAVDFVFRKEGYNASDTLWALLGSVGKKQGFEWGGDWQGFVDRPHFEMKLGYSLKDFQSNKVDWNQYE